MRLTGGIDLRASDSDGPRRGLHCSKNRPSGLERGALSLSHLTCSKATTGTIRFHRLDHPPFPCNSFLRWSSPAVKLPRSNNGQPFLSTLNRGSARNLSPPTKAFLRTGPSSDPAICRFDLRHQVLIRSWSHSRSNSRRQDWLEQLSIVPKTSSSSPHSCHLVSARPQPPSVDRLFTNSLHAVSVS